LLSTTQSSTSAPTSAAAIAIQVPQGQPLQQIPSTPDSFNTDNDTLRYLTITAQVLDSKYKVIGTVIAPAKSTNLQPGQQTSFSGLGSVSWGTKPAYFKLTFDWL
jgi:hypothetical protein